MLARLSLLDGAVIVVALAAIGAVLRYFLGGAPADGAGGAGDA